jgi:hypothetical protein
MFMPIPATEIQSQNFVQTYEAALWLLNYIGGSHYSDKKPAQGAITGKFVASTKNALELRYSFHKQVYNGHDEPPFPVSELQNSNTKNFLRMKHHLRNIMTMDIQCKSLYPLLHSDKKQTCQTAFKIATSEILDNDHDNLYPTKRTPFYDIVSLGFDITRAALDRNYSIHDMYENSLDLIEQSYYMKTVYAAQGAKNKSKII